MSSKQAAEVFKNKIAYHGTALDFAEFRPNTYFTSCPDEASMFATGEIWGENAIELTGSRVIPVFLNFKNPFIITDESLYEELVMDSVDIEKYKKEGYDGLVYAPLRGNIYSVIFDNDAVVYALDIQHGRSSLNARKH